MSRYILFAALSLVSGAAMAQANKSTTAKAGAKPATKPPTTTAVFKNNMDSVSYAVGLRIVENLKANGLEKVNMSLLQRAITDASQNKPSLLNEAAITQCMTKLSNEMNAANMEKMRKENAAISETNRKEGQAFLAANAKRAGVVTLPNGLQYEVLKAGTDNTHPTLASRVKCHYTGTLINGTKFDSSVDRGEPTTFALTNVITGWQQAIQLMTVGSKWKIYVPAELGYGDNPRPGGPITPGATLVFEVELLGIEN
jgi:FKBP-type peptidyl-prolyl cis-trans isomerase FklB